MISGLPDLLCLLFLVFVIREAPEYIPILCLFCYLIVYLLAFLVHLLLVYPSFWWCFVNVLDGCCHRNIFVSLFCLPIWCIGYNNSWSWLCYSLYHGWVLHHRTCCILIAPGVGYLSLLYLKCHFYKISSICFIACVCHVLILIGIPGCVFLRACTRSSSDFCGGMALAVYGMHQRVGKKWAVPATM